MTQTTPRSFITSPTPRLLTLPLTEQITDTSLLVSDAVPAILLWARTKLPPPPRYVSLTLILLALSPKPFFAATKKFSPHFFVSGTGRKGHRRVSQENFRRILRKRRNYKDIARMIALGRIRTQNPAYIAYVSPAKRARKYLALLLSKGNPRL